MANTKYINVPFASDGDTTTIPTEVQSDGSISWGQGWGPDYQRDLETDNNAKAIERDTMNQLFFVLSTIAQWYQQNTLPEFITSDQNNGQAYSYLKGASVVYTDQSGARTLWTSVADGNTDTPGSSDKWKPYLFRTANNAEVSDRSGEYPVTPQQVVDIIYNTVEYPIASTAQRGIVQLNDGLNAAIDDQAATANAVSQKWTHFKNSLDEANIDEIKAFSQRAVYFQASQAYATNDRGYPVEEAGILLCAGQINNALMQAYWSENHQFWTRTYNNQEDKWNNWGQIEPVFVYGTNERPGILQLADDPLGSNQELAASQLLTSQKFNYYKAELNVTNVDNIMTPGAYYQDTARNATPGRNYPITEEGQLIVTGTTARQVQQTYIAASGQVYARQLTANQGDWSAWKKPPSVPTGAIIPFALPGKGAAPEGYYVCNGGLINRADEPDLFAFIGTRYNRGGESDDQFRLPNIPYQNTLIANNGSDTSALTTAGIVKTHSHPGSTTSAAGVHHHALYTIKGDKYSGNGGVNAIGQEGRDTGKIGYNEYGGGGSASRGPNWVGNAGNHTHSVVVGNNDGASSNYAAGNFMLMCIKA